MTVRRNQSFVDESEQAEPRSHTPAYGPYRTIRPMKNCSGCGAVSAEDVRFCSSCGRPVTTSDDALDTPTVSMASELERAGLVAATGAQHPSQLGAFAPGVVLAQRYRVVALLGRGGMGEVYRAEDLKLRNPVALKFLAPDLQNDAAALSHLYDEVRNAREIAHPSVCRVYDIGENDGQHFLTMEYVDGEDLAALLRRIRRLPADKALETSHQICAGLAAVHDAGLLHRDLKPANVMLDGRGRVRITDFGLALRSATSGSRTSSAGTPPYMAPEQISNGETSIQSDIYSLGLVLYELFTGHLPYDYPASMPHTPGRATPSPATPSPAPRSEKSFDSWRHIHMEAVPTPMSAHVRDIHPVVETTILACLQKDPAARPATVQQVAESLASIALAEVHPSSAITAGSASTDRATAGTSPQDINLQPGFPRVAVWLSLVLLIAAAALAYFFFGRQKHQLFAHFSIAKAIDSQHVRSTAISPDGRFIASVIRDNGAETLWLHNVPTNSERPLLQDPAIHYQEILFSPDSSYIYYTTLGKGPGSDDEYRVPVLGGTPSRVLQSVDAPISFIGNGQRVCVFRQDDATEIWKFFSASADGGDEQLLYSAKYPYPQLPTCSPDGKVAILEDDAGKLETLTFATGKRQLLVPPTSSRWFYALQWDPTGKGIFAVTVQKFHYSGQLGYVSYPEGKFHQITNDLNNYSGISVTADARTIATTQKDRNTRFINLSLADTSHPEEHRLGDLEWFTWLDKDHLLISGDDSVLKTADLSGDRTTTLNVAKDHFFFQPALCGADSIVASGNTSDQKTPGIYKMQLDGSVATRLTQGAQDLWPQCTPDGKQLLWSDDRDDQKPVLMQLPLAGGAARSFAPGVFLQVARNGQFVAVNDLDTMTLKLFSLPALRLYKTMPLPPHASHFIALSADSKSLYYFSRTEAATAVMRMPLDKGKPAQLANFPGRSFQYMQASPDGSTLGLVGQEPQSQVILLHDTP